MAKGLTPETDISGMVECVEKPAETQSSIRLASHLATAHNSRSGGREFESPMWRELGALTEDPWGQIFLQM
jgi:hypothetical protein